MEKFNIIVILVCSWMVIGIGRGESLIEQKENYTLRVYVHEFLSGPNATLHEIARAAITADSATEFGLMRVADDLITSGPNYTEVDKLGRAQGCVLNAGLAESGVLINVNFVFTADPYKDSFITILGWKNTSPSRQEIPIVGGNGVFQSVRGHAVAEILSYDPLTNYLVLVYEFYLKSRVPADH